MVIGWAILATLATLAAIFVRAGWLHARARRERRSLRHITGCPPWWGKK